MTKEILVRVLLLLQHGKLKAEYIHFNEEPILSVITLKTKDYLNSKYINYKILGVYIFECSVQLPTIL